MIGVTGTETYPYSSPMYFPTLSAADALIHSLPAAAAAFAIPQGKTKLATLMCVELDGCTNADRIFAEDAPKLGFELVYRGRTSVAQPDFTAECLAARNAGAQVFYVLLEQASIARVREIVRPTGLCPSVLPVRARHGAMAHGRALP